jgi:hypothetical protein
MSGKGDRYRPVNVEAYKANHDRIFRQATIDEDAEHCSVLDIEPCETLLKKATEAVARCPHTVDIEALISDSVEAEGDE